jgi:hypothetical protein
MTRLIKRLTIACAVMSLIVAGYAEAASAASDTSVAPCQAAWLRLWGALGERCYTGNGTIVANLSGVNREQIAGTHTVCLTITPHPIICATGPRLIGIAPPVHISRIVITTP